MAGNAPSDDLRDLALGRFMDAWSQLEGAMRRLLAVLGGLEWYAAGPIAAAIPDNGRMAELLVALGRARKLPKEELETLEDLLKGLKTYMQRRNAIVHGQWCLINKRGETELEGAVHPMMWIRTYVFIDQVEGFHAAMGRGKTRHKDRVFTITQLNEQTAKTVKLGGQFLALADRLQQIAEGDTKGGA